MKNTRRLSSVERVNQSPLRVKWAGLIRITGVNEPREEFKASSQDLLIETTTVDSTRLYPSKKDTNSDSIRSPRFVRPRPGEEGFHEGGMVSSSKVVGAEV